MKSQSRRENQILKKLLLKQTNKQKNRKQMEQAENEQQDKI